MFPSDNGKIEGWQNGKSSGIEIQESAARRLIGKSTFSQCAQLAKTIAVVVEWKAHRANDEINKLTELSGTKRKKKSVNNEVLSIY